MIGYGNDNEVYVLCISYCSFQSDFHPTLPLPTAGFNNLVRTFFISNPSRV